VMLVALIVTHVHSCIPPIVVLIVTRVDSSNLLRGCIPIMT
jgi:hypothetical protein